nr:hypothetical protein [Rectinema sp.]
PKDKALHSNTSLLLLLVDRLDGAEMIIKLCFPLEHFPIVPMNSNQVSAAAFKIIAKTSCRLPNPISKYGPISSLSSPRPFKPSPIHNPTAAKQPAGTFCKQYRRIILVRTLAHLNHLEQ